MEPIQRRETALRVIGICGSLRSNSYTRMALHIALRGAQEVGAQIQLIDLCEYQLVFCDGNQDESAYPPDIFRLRTDVRQAQGIILGTPEYHNSMSGVLKNALDLMGFAEFEGKMIGLVSVSGGTVGAVDALNSLRNIGRALHAWVVPEQVAVPEAWKAFDATGQPQHTVLKQRLMEVGRQVARFAYLHTSEQALDFLRAWESAPVNPGAEKR